MVTYIMNRVNCWEAKAKAMLISSQVYIEIYRKVQRLSKAIQAICINVTIFLNRISYKVDEASRVHEIANHGSAL